MSLPKIQTFSSSTSTNSIDFDESNLTAGERISDLYDGVEFSSSSEFGLMLFDTDNVTGEDFDLATKDLENVLIISEDGDANDPDDLATGGTINLSFDELVAVNNIGLLDIDEAGSSITFYDRDSNPIETIEVDNLGDNSFQKLEFDVTNVASLDINLAGSGAVTGIDYQPVENDTYSNIYVFGDSLVDTGNLFNVTSFAQESPALSELELLVLPPSPPYFAGRFSNGPIWIDNVADEWEIELTNSTEISIASPNSDLATPVTLIDGNPVISPFYNGNTGDRSINFGYGLATTGASGNGEIGSLVPGIEKQVESFVADRLQANQAADEDALYILWGGSNDYFVGDDNPELVIDNIETNIESLYDSGARNFLVANLPDLGTIPEANNPDLAASPEELSQLSDTHNSLLDESVNELEDSLTGANITVLDINTLFDDIQTNPEEFGLTNVTESFLDPLTLTPTAGANPDDYLFYDTLHPTEAGHAIVSDFALETLAVEADI